MKKKETFSKKLILNKQTIATLKSSEMYYIQAGEVVTQQEISCRTRDCTCTITNGTVTIFDCY